MLRANELRIGNLIYYHIKDKLNEPEEWDAENIVDCFDIAQITEHRDDHEYKPIPLTEEWLLKFGFEVINHSGTNFWSIDIEGDTGCHPELYLHFHIKNGEIVNSGLTSGETDNEYGYEGERTHLENSIKFVHQLQNLYFALTGKELEI